MVASVTEQQNYSSVLVKVYVIHCSYSTELHEYDFIGKPITFPEPCGFCSLYRSLSQTFSYFSKQNENVAFTVHLLPTL